MEVGPSVAVIDIIGVLPDIAAENGLAAMHEGALAVERLHHDLSTFHDAEWLTPCEGLGSPHKAAAYKH
jgi:hypothetical protein